MLDEAIVAGGANDVNGRFSFRVGLSRGRDRQFVLL